MHRGSSIKGKWDNKEVTVDGIILSPNKSQSIWNHSPDGFSWSYMGSGPAQLSLALLLEATDDNESTRFHQGFKFDIIASLPAGDFEMPAEHVYEWLEIEKQKLHR